MALTLSLLRHAKSSWSEPELDDFERGLAPRGLKAAPAIAAAMRTLGLVPDLILCSTAMRTRATLSLVLPELRIDPPPEILYEDQLYLALPDTLLDRLMRVPDGVRHVLMVGHNPGLHALALALTGRGERPVRLELASKFPTATLAVIGFDAEHWSDIRAGAGSLEHFLTPRGLKD